MYYCNFDSTEFISGDNFEELDNSKKNNYYPMSNPRE
jgi:hypothetical protein